jgi:hypothetical protein
VRTSVIYEHLRNHAVSPDASVAPRGETLGVASRPTRRGPAAARRTR